MSTETLADVDIQKFAKEVRALANALYQTPGYKRILSMPLNMVRARLYTLQKAHWNINRRDCWAFAQGHAPMDVKRLIWEHEEDELAGQQDPRRRGSLFSAGPPEFIDRLDAR